MNYRRYGGNQRSQEGLAVSFCVSASLRALVLLAAEGRLSALLTHNN